MIRPNSRRGECAKGKEFRQSGEEAMKVMIILGISKGETRWQTRTGRFSNQSRILLVNNNQLDFTAGDTPVIYFLAYHSVVQKKVGIQR